MSTSTSGTTAPELGSSATRKSVDRDRLGNILIVDDSQTIRRSLVKILQKEGYHALETEDGPSALKLLGREEVDILVTDLKMPVMDGLELTHEAKKLQPTIEVIVLTAFGTVETAVEAMRMGAYHFVTKPIERTALLKTLEQAIEKRHLVTENQRLQACQDELHAKEHEARLEAERAVAARDRILGIVAHDLRSPLSTIALSTVLLESPLSDEQKAQQILVVRRSVEHMNQLIQDLLDVARIEAGHLSVALQPFEPAELLLETIELQRPLALAKSIVLGARLEGHPPAVQADRTRILQVFSNLIGNAIKHTPKGGQILVWSAQTNPEEVVFSVKDTGPGIREEDQPKLFDAFWQVQQTGREGAGLGLAITKGIVEAHGGRIWVESRPSQGGTTFSFVLRVAGVRTAER